MGLVNFYHRFVPQCAQILHPLNALLSAIRPAQQLIWTEEATTAFNDIKQALAQATLLNYPKPSAPTCIISDAFDIAVGAVLQQLIGDVWCPISYFSKKLKPSETRYSTFDRELLAIYLAISTSGISRSNRSQAPHICIPCRCRPSLATADPAAGFHWATYLRHTLHQRLRECCC